jgi:hypothetical protein
MPRPKPQEKLIVKSVRLTEAQWVAFNQLGGSDWLRSRITKLNITGIAKRQRNTAIKRAVSAGESLEEIAKRFGVHKTTAWRIAK